MADSKIKAEAETEPMADGRSDPRCAVPKLDGSPTRAERKLEREEQRETAKRRRWQVKQLEVETGRRLLGNRKQESRRERALRLRIAGYSLREIADELDCSIETVHQDVNVSLTKLRAFNDRLAEDLRQLELERLDKMTRVLLRRLDDEKYADKHLESIDTLIKVQARRAKLVGLDAPTRSELSGPEGAPIEIDARNALLEQLDKLVGREVCEAASGEPQDVPGEPEPGAGESPAV